MFSRAAKKIGVANKCTVFCSAAQRKIFELRTKALNFVQLRCEIFWNLPTKATQIDCIRFSRAAKDFGLRSKALRFVLPRSEKKFGRRKILEFPNKSLSN
jgi:hypothetical protein